jgi:hypothetical protein
VSGDRQSATELARRAATASPVRAMAMDDLRLQGAQQAQQKSHEPALQKEVNQDVQHTEFGIGF